jgi:hypothetical protein
MLACLLAPAGAHAIEPPQIISFYADPHSEPNQDPTELFAQGQARFSGEDPVTVGQDPPGDPQRREVGLFGMDARNIAIYQPDVADATLWFAMSFWDLQVVAAEAATWRWTFKLDDTPYQLEAMRGGLTATSTREAGEAEIIGSVPPHDVFRLLGPCSVAGELRCPFNRSMSGEIDMNSDRVIWKLPIELPFEVGSVITPHPAGAVASFGAGPGSFTDQVVQTGSYTALSRRVLISVRVPGGATVVGPYAAFIGDADGAGSTPFFVNVLIGSLDRGALGPTTPYEVVALACSGQACSAPEVVTVYL